MFKRRASLTTPTNPSGHDLHRVSEADLTLDSRFALYHSHIAQKSRHSSGSCVFQQYSEMCLLRKQVSKAVIVVVVAEIFLKSWRLLGPLSRPWRSKLFTLYFIILCQICYGWFVRPWREIPPLWLFLKCLFLLDKRFLGGVFLTLIEGLRRVLYTAQAVKPNEDNVICGTGL